MISYMICFFMVFMPNFACAQMTNIITTPLTGTATVQTAQSMALDVLTRSTLPIFSIDNNNKLYNYKTLILGFTPTTSAADLKNTLDMFNLDILSSVLSDSNITLDNLTIARSALDEIVYFLINLNRQIPVTPATLQMRTNINDELIILRARVIDLRTKYDKQKAAAAVKVVVTPVVTPPVVQPAPKPVVTPVTPAPVSIPVTPAPTSAPTISAAQPVTAGQTMTLDVLAKSTMPVFSGDNNNKMFQYKTIIANFNATTPAADFKKAVDLFIVEVVGAASASTATIDNLSNAKMTADTIISNLASLNNQLASKLNTAEARATISTSLMSLKARSSELGKKFEKQKTFLNTLDSARKIPYDQLAEKTAQYALIIQRVDSELLDSVKQKIIEDISNVVVFAKSKGLNLVALQKLTSDVQSIATFSLKQKEKLAGLFFEKPVVVNKSVQITPPAAQVKDVKGDVLIQNKLKEMASKKIWLEKVLTARELLALVGAGTIQADKNAVIAQLNDLFAQHGQMTKQELEDLRITFADASVHPYLFVPKQRVVVEQWAKLIDQALPFGHVKEPLIWSLKTALTKVKENYLQTLQAAAYTVNLLSTKLPAQELDKRNQSSIVSVLRSQVSVYYNKRSNKTLDELSMLRDVLTMLQKNSYTTDVVSKQWIEAISLGVSFATMKAQKEMLSRLTMLLETAKLIKPTTDSYEKSMFLDEFATLFANRFQRAAREIALMNDIAQSFYKSQTGKKAIFEKSDMEKLSSWTATLNATYTLLTTSQQEEIAKKINSLQKLLPFLAAPQAAYERSLFFPIVSDVFALRGHMINGELVATKKFFQQVKAGNILTPSELVSLDSWISELTRAATMTVGPQKYIDACIQTAVNEKSVVKMQQVVDLFVKPEPKAKDTFVKGLNTLFVARKNIDPTALINLFTAVGKKMISSGRLLTDGQMTVLNKWLEMIKSETVVAKK